jgi:hypothetical protein
VGGDLGALVFELGEAGQDAGAQRRDGLGSGVVSEGFDLTSVGVLGGINLPQPPGQNGGLLVAASLVVGGGVGQVGGEQGGAVGAEDPLGEELADDGEQVVFADRDGAGWPSLAVWRGLAGSWWQA